MTDHTGFHNSHHTQSPKVMFIDSKDANVKHETDTHFTYVFNDSIHVKQNEGVLVSLLQASIPYSFYNVRGDVNDTLVVRVQVGNGTFGDNTIVTIPDGNYTATSLRKKIKSELENLMPSTVVTIDFDRDRMKFEFSVNPVTITSAVADVRGVVLHLPASSDLAVMLGFTTTQDPVFFGYLNPSDAVHRHAGTAVLDGSTTTVVSSEGLLTSNNVADLNGGIHSLYLRTNLPVISSMDSATGGVSQILAKIPIMSGPGSIIFHEPQNSVHKSLIQSRSIRFITVRLTDDRNRLVSLNGLDFSVALMFEFVTLRLNDGAPSGTETTIKEINNKEINNKENNNNEKKLKSKKKGRKLNPNFLSLVNNKEDAEQS
jgi:hypothetical protein